MKTLSQQLESIQRGVVDCISSQELESKLKTAVEGKKPLRVKLGVDPSTADIHLGHTVVLQKLRQFQDLGHQAVLIIGDYTAMVGDPSGRDVTRPQLTFKQVREHAKTYVSQVGKLLDLPKTEIRYNSEWFQPLTFLEVIQLASKMTVARMLERDDFSKRYREGNSIAIHEFIYPLMQGYDSVQVKADIELGGTDQLFNLLVGRQLQKEEGHVPQAIITVPLLVGTDGAHKMSKSLNNAIGISDSPQDMYGKVMSISDALMWHYYELLSACSLAEIQSFKDKIQKDQLNPKLVKELLGMELVSRFHSKQEATAAQLQFQKIFHNKEVPEDMEEVKISISEEIGTLPSILLKANLVSSSAEAKRLIRQGGVSVNQKKITDITYALSKKGEYVLKVGKRKFMKVTLT